MELDDINKRIKREICYDTLDKLSDNNLLDQYRNSVSVQQKINTLEETLRKYEVEEEKIKNIVNDYILELIPAGTKGVIRGNVFNQIIKTNILNMEFITRYRERFEIQFEKKQEDNITTEIPDWYILDKITNKIMIGMNQLDLWGGGHQLNRGSKYIIQNVHNNDKSKMICVICNPVELKSKNNKTYQLFNEGFTHNTLCYRKQLENIIVSYFGGSVL